MKSAILALIVALTLAAPASAVVRRNVQVQKIVTVQPRVQRVQKIVVAQPQQIFVPHVQQFVAPQQFYAPAQQLNACPQQLNGGCQSLFR